jgi:hypothetical protein
MPLEKVCTSHFSLDPFKAETVESVGGRDKEIGMETDNKQEHSGNEPGTARLV